MYKFLWAVFVTLSFSFVSANAQFDCPVVSIDVEAEQLNIDGLTAPIEIVKVFNASYNLIYQCNGDCPENIELNNLTAGDYNIDIQSYTDNWRFICDQKELITISSDIKSSCENIKIKVEDNQLIIDGLTAPNKIVKVFDVFYNLISVCFVDCENTIIIPNLLSGVYHVDIQLYTANWAYICNLQEDAFVELDATPCDNSSCDGNVNLSNQEAIDNFCACKTIEGDLIIGNLTGSNINSLANLRNIERVKGKLLIQGTNIKDFDGLGNLGFVGKDVMIHKNLSLKNCQGLNNLVEIGGVFKLSELPEIVDLQGLDRWTKAIGIDFNKNNSLTNADKIAQVSNLATIKLTNNPQLTELPALTLLSSLSGINISNNAKFQNLNFLGPIGFLSGMVTIQSNPALTDCCEFSYFVDDDLLFGTNDAVFNIGNNPFSCQSIPTILSECQVQTSSCADVQVNAAGEQITILGLTMPNVIMKIFDENYNPLFDCFGDCENNYQLEGLSRGLYRVNINFYNANWIPICETIITVVLTGRDATVSFSDRASADELPNTNKFLITPNPAYDATFVDLKELVGQRVGLQLIDQFGKKVWSKEIPQASLTPEKIEVSSFENGLYFLRIQSPGQRTVTQKLVMAKLY